MERDELIRMFVLDVMADDYENLEMIYGELHKFGERCGLTLQASEILAALIQLIELGLALWQPPVREIEGYLHLTRLTGTISG